MRLRFLIPCVFLLSAVLSAGAQQPDFSMTLSSLAVTSFAQDREGYLWIGTERGLNRYNGSNYSIFYASGVEGGLNNDHILALAADPDGSLWIGNECGLSHFIDGRFHQMHGMVFDPCTAVVRGNADNLFIAGKSGIFKVGTRDLDTRGHYYDEGASMLTRMVASTNGDLWLVRRSGGRNILTVLGGEMLPRQEIPLGEGKVTGLCTGEGNEIWVSTEEAGLRCFEGLSLAEVPLPRELLDLGKVVSLLPCNGSILVAVEDRGLYAWRSRNRSLTHILKASPKPGADYIGFADRDGGIWLSDGHSDLLYRAFNQPFLTLTVSPELERIHSLVFDRSGRLWVRLGDSLAEVDPDSGEVLWRDDGHQVADLRRLGNGDIAYIRDQEQLVRFTPAGGRAPRGETVLASEGELFSLGEGPGGRLFASRLSDLLRIDRVGGAATRVDVGHPFSLLLPVEGTDRVFLTGLDSGILEVREDGVLPLHPDLRNVSSKLMAPDGVFWAGTWHDGLLRYDERKSVVERFPVSVGLSDSGIRAVALDRHGMIWFTTASHVSRFDPATRSLVSLHDSRFSNGRNYERLCAAVAPDGRLYFGGSGSVTVIDPDDYVPAHKEIPLRLEFVSVNNAQLSPRLERLDLKWKENTLLFRFAGLDFTSGTLLNYSWKLDGFEKDWQQGRAGDGRALYNYLPAGRYTFRARVRSLDGTWSASQIALPVVIRPAPWASPLAKAAYVLVGLGLIAFLFWIVIRLRTQRERLALAEERERMKQRQIDFVTDISHEFRTPLTLIYGPAKALKESTLPEKEHELAVLVADNAEKLRTLSSQILSADRVLDGGTEHANWTANDLAAAVRSRCDMFRYAASQRELTLECEIPECMVCAFDGGIVEKILNNLLSNAIKYTPTGGHVRVELERRDGEIFLRVADDGVGIAPEKRERIFARFDRLGAERTATEGSGIGLHYARSLARLHEGDIRYEANTPAGSVFTFVFPDRLPETVPGPTPAGPPALRESTGGGAGPAQDDSHRGRYGGLAPLPRRLVVFPLPTGPGV